MCQSPLLYLLKVVVLCTEYNLHKANFFTLLFNLDFSSILPFLFFSIYNKLKQNSADIDQVSWWHWYYRQNDMGKKICQSFHWHPDYKPKRVATDMWDRWEVKKPGTVGCMHGMHLSGHECPPMCYLSSFLAPHSPLCLLLSLS